MLVFDKYRSSNLKKINCIFFQYSWISDKSCFDILKNKSLFQNAANVVFVNPGWKYRSQWCKYLN